MKQIVTAILLVFGFYACETSHQSADSLLGKWDNRAGQILQFKADGKAWWIFDTEARRDTFEIQYRTDFSKDPQQIDLTDFKVGPLTGKTLYGIIEFTDQHTIRLDFEPSVENRPTAFDTIQTQTYFRIQ